LARAYAAMHGSSASEVQNAYNRAERLMRDVEDVLLDFRVRWGGWLMHFIHGELQAAQGVAQRLLRHPACTDHPICRLEAHHAMWDTLFHLGKMQTALAYHFDGMVMMASNPLKRMHYDYGRFTGNHDPHVCCLSRAALTLWLSGFLDQAIDTSNTAVARADEVDCINSRAHANAYAAITQLLARYPEKALQHANVALLIAKEDGLPQHLAMAEILSRLADAHLHPSESAIERAEDATARWQDLRIGILQTFWEGQIAEACLMAGSIRKGLQHIGHAVQALDRTHERFYGPELHRLKGELLLAESRKNRSEAKRQFYQAIELARECTMRLLALRSLLGLNKMLVDRDRGSEEERRIREDLVRAYDWYTQGPDTPDLLDTQAFLGTSVPCGSSTSSFGSVIPD